MFKHHLLVTTAFPQHIPQPILDLGGCQNDGPFLGTLNMGIIGTILGFYGDNGKENGNYYIGVISTLLVPFWVPEI